MQWLLEDLPGQGEGGRFEREEISFQGRLSVSAFSLPALLTSWFNCQELKCQAEEATLEWLQGEDQRAGALPHSSHMATPLHLVPTKHASASACISSASAHPHHSPPSKAEILSGYTFLFQTVRACKGCFKAVWSWLNCYFSTVNWTENLPNKPMKLAWVRPKGFKLGKKKNHPKLKQNINSPLTHPIRQN